MIEFSCTKCGQKLNVEDKHSGKRVRCPKCGEVGFVPDNSDKIEFHCESCGQSISVPKIHAGKKGKCPKCKNLVVVPSLRRGPLGDTGTFSVVCSMCEEIIQVPETSREQTIECPACGSYVEASSGSGPTEPTESGPSIPSSTDEDQYEDDFEAPEESAGLGYRLILVICGATAIVVVGLIILVTVILPSGSHLVEGPESRREREDVVDADLGRQPVISDTRPKEPVPLADQLSGRTKIAFTSGRGINAEICVVNADGTERKRLTDNRARDTDPIWSPDGKKIAFVSTRDGNGEIYIMNADGSEQRNLSDNPAQDFAHSFSPDGKKIAFKSERDRNYEIYVMNADGTEQKRLTNNPQDDDRPRWSPDGKKIAFVSGRDGNKEIYVMSADGSEQRNLSNNPAHDFAHSFSPDGQKIAFQTDRDGKPEIYVMNADGSEQKNLTKNPATDEGLIWSPDGKRIAFASFRGKKWDIYIMNTDGTHQKNLSNSRLPSKFPSWSPDGRKIVFHAIKDNRYDLLVINADGSEQRNLTNDPSTDLCPSWSPFLSSETRPAQESESQRGRQDVANTDSRSQPLTSDTQPTEPMAQELQKEERSPAVQYKLKFERGQSYYVRVISDANAVQEVTGQVIINETTSGFGYSFDVSEVDEKGNGWVDCTVDWVMLRQKSPSIEVIYDSSKKPSRVPALAQRHAGFLGERFSAKMTPQGQVEELRELEKLRKNMEKKIRQGRMKQQIMQTLEEQQLADLIKDVLLSPIAVYPDKPVVIGDSWSRTGFLSSRQPLIYEHKWTLKDRKAGTAIIEASAAIASSPDVVQRQGVKLKYDMSGKLVGQIEIKESTGQIIHSEMTEDLSGQAQVDTMAIRMKTHTVTTFEMTERRD